MIHQRSQIHTTSRVCSWSRAHFICRDRGWSRAHFTSLADPLFIALVRSRSCIASGAHVPSRSLVRCKAHVGTKAHIRSRVHVRSRAHHRSMINTRSQIHTSSRTHSPCRAHHWPMIHCESMIYKWFRNATPSSYVTISYHIDSESFKTLFLLITRQQFFHLSISMEITAEIYKKSFGKPIASIFQIIYKHRINLYKNRLNDFGVDLNEPDFSKAINNDLNAVSPACTLILHRWGPKSNLFEEL